MDVAQEIEENDEQPPNFQPLDQFAEIEQNYELPPIFPFVDQFGVMEENDEQPPNFQPLDQFAEIEQNYELPELPPIFPFVDQFGVIEENDEQPPNFQPLDQFAEIKQNDELPPLLPFVDPLAELEEDDEQPPNLYILGQFAPQQVNHQMVIAPIHYTNATGTQFHDLDPDSLRHIVSQPSLTAKDLLALSDTCKLLQQITPQVFPSNWQILCKSNEFNFTIDNCLIVANSSKANRILKIFGAQMVRLNLHEKEETNIMHMLADHCEDGKLTELAIANEKVKEINELLAVSLSPILQKLHLLDVMRATIDCSVNVFASCVSLIELKIRTHPKSNLILLANFPNLQQFTFTDSKREGHHIGSEHFYLDSEQILLNFFERHKTLKTVHLELSSQRVVADLLRNWNSCKELEELAIDTKDEYDTPLDFSNFASLKRLKLFRRDEYSRVSPASLKLQNLTSLESLTVLGTFDSNEVLETLPLLTNLRVFDADLYLVRDTIQWATFSQLTWLRVSTRNLENIHNVADMISQLENLKDLEFYRTEFVLSKKMLCDIGKVVRERPHVLSFKCCCAFSHSSKHCEKICRENPKLRLLQLEE